MKAKFTKNSWVLKDISILWEHTKIAAKKYNLDYFEPQFEIVGYSQMIDAMSTLGLPESYAHWSIGKNIVEQEKSYKISDNPLAYELIINSDPAVTYIMENNSFATNCLVLPHASIGHANFFKNNYEFKQWTNPKSIIPYMAYVKEYIEKLEKEVGHEYVEFFLSHAHTLKNHAIDSKKIRLTPSIKQERTVHPVLDLLEPVKESNKPEIVDKQTLLHKLDEENIMKFVVEHSTVLHEWQKNILIMLSNIEQYFYPQKLTKVMNEGWASFWHYQLLNDFYDTNIIDESLYLDAIKTHTNVIYSGTYKSTSHINPYYLGFNMFMDLKNVCINPTKEDFEYFPDIAGKKKDWVDILKDIAYNYNDESFIYDYLSPRLMRKMKLFSVTTDFLSGYSIVKETSSESINYLDLRRNLSKQYNINFSIPNIRITRYDVYDHVLYIDVIDDFGNKDLTDESREELTEVLSYFLGIRFLRIN